MAGTCKSETERASPSHKAAQLEQQLEQQLHTIPRPSPRCWSSTGGCLSIVRPFWTSSIGPGSPKWGFWAQELVEASSNRGPTLTVSCQAWAATEELARRVVVGQALQAYEEHETTELS